VGRFTSVDGGTAVFALPNETHRSFCEELRLDVESALRSHFGVSVPLHLVVDDELEDEGGRGSGRRAARDPAADPSGFDDPRDDEPDLLDPVVLAAETEPAGAGLSPEQRLKQAFPGAQEV